MSGPAIEGQALAAPIPRAKAHARAGIAGIKAQVSQDPLMHSAAEHSHGSEVELLKLRQLAVERTAEFEIHEYRQQDQRDYGGYAYEARHAGGSAIDRALIGADDDVCGIRVGTNGV